MKSVAMCEFSLFGNHFCSTISNTISNASQKQSEILPCSPSCSKHSDLNSMLTHCLLTLLASLDAMSVLLHKDVCPYMCVGVCGGEMDPGEQLARANSSAGQSRASLDSHARCPTHK